MNKTYEDIHNHIDQALTEVDGLLIALRVLVHEGSEFGGNTPEVTALRSLIAAINRSVGEMIEYQCDAWKVMLTV